MREAILLIDHGSRRKAAHDQLLELAMRVSAASPGETIVEIAHMEIAEPSILTGFRKCCELGAGRVVAIPCLLSRGRHVAEDIPRLLEEAAEGMKVPYVLAAPLVEHEGFIDLLISAAQRAAQGSEGEPKS